MYKLSSNYQWVSSANSMMLPANSAPNILPPPIWQEPLSLPIDGFELKPIQLSDASTWAACLNLPEVFEHTSWNMPSVSELEMLIRSYNQGHADSPLQLGIYQTSDHRLCGAIGFHTISQVNHSAELAYNLHPNFWGRGLITQSARSLINWGFTHRHYQRIQATILPENLASIKVIERLGFQYEGRLRNFRMVRGEPRDYLMYSFLPK